MRLSALLLAVLPLLAGCATTSAPRQASAPAPERVATPPTNPQAPPSGGFIAPRVMNLPGLEGVIGQDAGGLQARFGAPRLDVVEGDARKLQFEGQACILDVYLYPLRPGAEPTATYVDARRASDGLDVDRAACAAALKR